LQDLFPDLGINYTLNLIGTVVSENANEAIIRWAADVNPNQCVDVNIGTQSTGAHHSSGGRAAGAGDAHPVPEQPL
jgi:hypothetical protein